MQPLRPSISIAAMLFVLSLIPATVFAAVGDQTAKLLPNDVGDSGDKFGRSVGISGNIAIVGVPRDNDNFTHAGSAYVFNMAGNQLVKLHASDPMESAYFGDAVAISGNIAIVGARNQNSFDGLINAGAAYLFNATSGALIAKLLPSDGSQEYQQFGLSVAISGSIAIVGAPGDDDNGTNSGAAYLFNANNGASITKLDPDDPAEQDRFGHSVGISGTTAVVGAQQDDDNGTDSGSACTFNTTTGSQIIKLLPSNSASFNRFGQSVGISGSVVIVGADRDGGAVYRSTLGGQSGAAFLFDGTTGNETAKLLASDQTGSDEFGRSVGISSTHAMVGARYDDDNGTSSGSAYLFDLSGTQIAKLLPDDGAAGDGFGITVAIDGIYAIGGALYHGDPGAAYLFGADADSDGDGLLDSWENLGVPYLDGSGVQQRFTLPGADPMRKDLYVEVDAMTGFSLSDGAVEQLEFAFGAAPLTNPKPQWGVLLHVLRDETDLDLVPVWDTDGCWPLDFDAKRDANFGTSDERTNADATALLAAKAMAYRYCIVADQAGPNRIGGCGDMPGDNSVLFLGGGAYDDEAEAALFMHELGHNLGLDHGGGDGINGKPNYPSIMNYLLADRSPWNTNFWKLDFSRAEAGAFASLNESSLDEFAGIGTSPGRYDNYQMPFGVNVDDGLGGTVRVFRYVILNGSNTDFGDPGGTLYQDGDISLGVTQDLNYFVHVPAGISIPSESSPGESLDPYDDWANVKLPLAATLGAGSRLSHR